MWVTPELVKDQEKDGKHGKNWSKYWVGRDKNTYMVAFKSITRTNKNEWTKTARKRFVAL